MIENELPYRERLALIRQGLATKTTGPKPKKSIPKIGKKRAIQMAAEKELGSDGSMDLFFDEMIKRCSGKCFFCNSKTTVVDNKLFHVENEKWSREANERKWEQDVKVIKRASIAHLLPKSKFKSIAAHEENWVELCWACHTSFDSGSISWLMLKDSKEWDILKEKLLLVLPMVAPEERKHKLYGKLISLVYDK